MKAIKVTPGITISDGQFNINNLMYDDYHPTNNSIRTDDYNVVMQVLRLMPRPEAQNMFAYTFASNL